MVQSKATTVEDYLDELPEERREAIEKVRKVIKKHLPKGYKEAVSAGMITYSVPLEKFSDTYNKQPLCYIGLAAQKNYNALYLMGAYGDPKREKALKDGFKEAGKKLDMGKSCVRFKTVEDLPLDVIGEAVAGISPDELITIHNKAHTRK